MKAKFTINDKNNNPTNCQSNIIQENQKTVWVSAPNGKQIKRHKVKHCVEIMEEV